MAWKHRTVAQELRIVELSNGRSQREVARLVGVSPWTVHDVQRKYHVTLSFGRSISSARFRYAYDEHAWGRVIEMLYHEQRLPLEEVARRCCVDVGTIRRRMDAIGLRRRSSGESNRGTKRGAYNWRPDLPRCPGEGCRRRVGKAGERYCAACRRKVAYRDG